MAQNPLRTTDNNRGNCLIGNHCLENLRKVANISIENAVSKHPGLLIFPNDLCQAENPIGGQYICDIVDENAKLRTGNIMGFVGVNDTRLSICSRFASNDQQDYFLHYMLQKVLHLNLFDWKYSSDKESFFDLLLYLFPAMLHRALQQGLYKEYITIKHNDANVRGTIDIARHIRSNVPFVGKVAYNTREYSHDNPVMQLVRHTIEHIRKHPLRMHVLNKDRETKDNVRTIANATSSYQEAERRGVIAKNLRPLHHPYFLHYRNLQRLCLQILRHEEIKYGNNDDKVYGVLFDGAWLWEEYVGSLLNETFTHYTSKGQAFYLFEDQSKNHIQRIIPDYISKDKKIVADAKYIPLDHYSSFDEERATAIYYKTVMYMMRFNSSLGMLFYPTTDKNKSPDRWKIAETNKRLDRIPLYIPQNELDFSNFADGMNRSEQLFIQRIAEQMIEAN